MSGTLYTFRRLPPSGKLAILIGLFFISIGISTFLQILILLPFADIKSLGDISALTDFSNPNILKGMKIAQGVSAVTIFIIPSLLFVYITSEEKVKYLRMNSGISLTSSISVLVLVLSAMPFINWLGEINSHLIFPPVMHNIEEWVKNSEENAKKLTDAFLEMNDVSDLLVNIVVIALLAAIGEEMFFRGCLQNSIIEWVGNKHRGIWITAIIFSASHMQFYGFLPRMVLGVMLGYIYMWSGSLWLSMLFHFLNNGLAVLFTYLIHQGMLSEEAETIGASNPIYYALASVVVSSGLLYIIYRERKNKDPVLIS